MIFKALDKIKSIPNPMLRNKLLDKTLGLAIPFNRGLDFKIVNLDEKDCHIFSPSKWRRRNHVGTAHACALALLGEYTSGLLIAQNFSMENYRIMISHLEIEYFKKGTGALNGKAAAPEVWPTITDEQTWIPMETHIYNEKNDLVATCKTKWQVKKWSSVKPLS